MQLHPLHMILRKKNHLIAMIATFDSKKKARRPNSNGKVVNVFLRNICYHLSMADCVALGFMMLCGKLRYKRKQSLVVCTCICDYVLIMCATGPFSLSNVIVVIY